MKKTQRSVMRAQWLAAPGREIIAWMDTKHESEEDVVAYAKERVAGGWNTWALVRGKDGLMRSLPMGYRYVDGHVGRVDLRDDVLTPRVLKALRAGIRSGERLHLTDQVDLEEWLILYGDEDG